MTDTHFTCTFFNGSLSFPVIFGLCRQANEQGEQDIRHAIRGFIDQIDVGVNTKLFGVLSSWRVEFELKTDGEAPVEIEKTGHSLASFKVFVEKCMEEYVY